MKHNDGGPAFPLQTTVASGLGGTIRLQEWQQEGMTMWDYYAAHALTGAMKNKWTFTNKGKELESTVPEHFALVAGMIADAMIAEREKRGKDENDKIQRTAG